MGHPRAPEGLHHVEDWYAEHPEKKRALIGTHAFLGGRSVTRAKGGSLCLDSGTVLSHCAVFVANELHMIQTPNEDHPQRTAKTRMAHEATG
jgi:hypothetical protein